MGCSGEGTTGGPNYDQSTADPVVAASPGSVIAASPAWCPASTASLDQHVAANRVTVQNLNFFTFTLPLYLAAGTREFLGVSGAEQVTLYQVGPNSYSANVANCPPTPPLAHCDQNSETAATPIVQACGDMTGVLGTNVQFGPSGAIMDRNVGQGFENTDPNDNSTCPLFVSLFSEPADETKQLLDVGPQPCSATAPNTGDCLDFKLYSTYRPAAWPEGKLPVITWANGTCAQPEGYGVLLRYVASYGFFVIAANSREVGTGKEALHALDYAKAANEDPSSPYYGHLDLSRVGVMGHSQGGLATVLAASDSRIQAAIIFNAANSASKPFLAISGDQDIVNTNPTAMAQAVNAAAEGAYLYYHNPAGASSDVIKGHLVLMLSPERIVDATTKWWQLVLNDDATARGTFVGASCGLCTAPNDYAFGEHGL